METVVIFSASAVAILGVLYNTLRAVDESTNTADGGSVRGYFIYKNLISIYI